MLQLFNNLKGKVSKETGSEEPRSGRRARRHIETERTTCLSSPQESCLGIPFQRRGLCVHLEEGIGLDSVGKGEDVFVHQVM